MQSYDACLAAGGLCTVGIAGDTGWLRIKFGLTAVRAAAVNRANSVTDSIWIEQAAIRCFQERDDRTKYLYLLFESFIVIDTSESIQKCVGTNWLRFGNRSDGESFGIS